MEDIIWKMIYWQFIFGAIGVVISIIGYIIIKIQDKKINEEIDELVKSTFRKEK